MKTVRFGIIGMGNIGRYHADYLLQDQVACGQLVAICSRNEAVREKYRPLELFDDALTLFRSGRVDAVLIATPHAQHADLGIAALEAGLHVLLEKPIAAHKADAERLVAAHQRQPDRVCGVMFQLRAEPRYQAIRDLLQRGELGELTRVNWITTDWFRPEAYYASSDWRATWKGEGGGVLLNQALHPLDMLQWLVGMPRRLRAFCRLGQFHQIEVEDDVTAVLEWGNGAMGVFVTSTGEAPGTNRLELCGTRGRLVLERDSLTHSRNAQDVRVFNTEAQEAFARLAHDTVQVPFQTVALPHALVVQNFVKAVLEGEPLLAPVAEGVGSVELANAMVLSSLAEQTLELPLNSALWASKLEELIAHSTIRKTVRPVLAADVQASFRK